MKLAATTDSFEMLRHIPAGIVGSARGNCEGCGMFVWSEGGYRVPGLPGIHCSVKCIETVLFGQERCRWCGRKMDKPHSAIDSRLCSRDCSEKYYAHVLGDKTARLGSGKRFLLWLQENRAAVYRQLLGQGTPESGYCQNPQCPNGEGGQPGSLALMRADAQYCNTACRMAAQRVLTPKIGTHTNVILLETSVTLRPGRHLGSTPAKRLFDGLNRLPRGFPQSAK
jgi:hypothetical protein